MTNAVDNRRAYFTYIWGVENASKLQLSKLFHSPVFEMDSEMQTTKWHLTMDLGRDYLTLFIRRAPDDDGPDTIDIDYEISLLSTDGHPLVIRMDRKQFKNCSNYALRRLASSDEVLNTRKKEFLSKDTLTVQCRIWRENFGLPKNDFYYTRTQLSMDRISFLWTIKNFSTLQQNEKRIHRVNSTSVRVPHIVLKAYLMEEYGKEHISIVIDRATDSKCHSIHGSVCLMDVDGRVYHSIQIEESIYRSNDSKWLTKASFSKSQIIANKGSLLPDDELTFRCEFKINMEPFCRQIEYYKNVNSSNSERIVTGIPEIQFVGDTPEQCSTISSLQKFLKDNFEKGTLSDVCLRAGSESFPVHKLILSAYSPVFKAIFTKYTQEKSSGSIYISDVDPSTLRLLLSYIYTNVVPKLQWKSAADLFKAADIYKLGDLRDICSDFLKSNLTVSNCCCALTIADRHHDQNLRAAVYGFLAHHQTEILKSDVWTTFKSENFALAMKTLEHIITSVKITDD